MKTLQAIAAVSIALVLALSPMIATAAGTITFTSPAAGASYSGSQSYTISGTISPAPTQADQVGITVKNPSGQTVDLASVTVTSGSFTYSTAVGGTSAWISGTYTITALDSYGATGTTTFSYIAPTSSSTSGFVTVLGPSLLLPGQTANVFIWSSGPGSVTAWYLAPGASSATTLTASSVSPSIVNGLDVYTATFTLAAGAPDGVYLVGASVTNSTSGFAASNIGSFTVNGQVASSAAVSTLSANVTAIQSGVTALQSAVASLGTAVGTIGTNVANIQTSLTGLTSAVRSINSNVTNITNQLPAAGSISNTQTYVLVVAVLAAITLVLELAILVRKLS